MLNRAFAYFKKLSLADFARKSMWVFLNLLDLQIARKIRSYLIFKTGAIKLGRGVVTHGIAFKIQVGKSTAFYDRCVFEFGHDCEVSIGSNVVFSYGVVFACRSKITIGNDVQVGEYTSIRDTTHAYENREQPIKYQPDKSSPIIIEDDVWIGRGCIVMPGTTIKRGAVIAANSVVKGVILEHSIYGGNPAKLLKQRP